MFRLTREVRLAFNSTASRDLDPQWDDPASNSFGGYPSLTGIGIFFTVQVTLKSDLDPRSQYVVNIKEIDTAVRDRWRDVEWKLRRERPTPSQILLSLFNNLVERWGDRIDHVSLAMSPFQQHSIKKSEFPMIRLSTRFEFSASHRLHNPAMSDEENRNCFGKCNNPHGHGHNYELQVTLAGNANANGVLVCVPDFERIVKEQVIDRFDHKNLNEEVAEFHNVIPSVENIAKTIYGILKPALAIADAKLASVTVWETAKTWCEYEE